MKDLRIARSELILGGQKSGKTARAESLAALWLAQSHAHRAVYIATAEAWDDEMRERIARHRRERAVRVPGIATVEEPLELARVIEQQSRVDTLVVVDCLTLWLTAMLLPSPTHVKDLELRAGVRNPAVESGGNGAARAAGALLTQAVRACVGPVVLVSNEIGLGVIPMGCEVRSFVDALGGLNQEAASSCERVTLMCAGLPLSLKGGV